MNIIIIGSSGFIGSHLFRYLNNINLQVTGCDIKSSDDPSLQTIILEKDAEDFTDLFRNMQFDICINASGSASVPFSIACPSEDFRLNATNVYLLLHAIRNQNPSCRFINFSSAAVYGNPIALPIKESMPSAPISPYGFHKMISEQICAEFWNLYAIHTCSLRIFSVYGPGLRKQLFWDLYLKLKAGKRVELFGTGKESRDFIYIDDICDAIYSIIKNAPMEGETINIASGQEITVASAVDQFVLEYDPTITVCFNGIQKKGDPNNWRADISELQGYGFRTNSSFGEGIQKFVKWIKELE